MHGPRIAVDIGGTFTDFVVEDGDSRHAFKLLTTPDAPARAVLAGIDQILRDMAIAPHSIAAVIHGTTLATNAVIERRGARVGFVTTAGFRDTLEMGYEYRFDQYDLLIDRTPPLVERALRFTVPERVAADGAVLTPLRDEDVAAVADALRHAAADAVAIGFLHAYRNPDHEIRAAQILAAKLPGTPICVSSDVCPEIREYERFSTVVANAYILPLMSRYLAAFQSGLRARGIAAPLLLIQSNGGLCDVAAAMRYPVRLLESGPAGGAIFAGTIAKNLGLREALLLDVGGTTAKLCFVDDGAPRMARGMEVGRVARFRAGSGLPLRFPVVEMCEIGAGGGSVARVDSLGRLQVGPRSAGAVPGPACYAIGGTEATVTDANLVLGRLDIDRFAGGSIRLDAAAAIDAVAARVATPLGLETATAAIGVLAILHEGMANAAREHAIDADCSLAGRALIGIGGGAGPHAAELAAALGIDTVVIPADAGVGSAVGFLRAPIAFERALSWPEPLAGMDFPTTRAVVERLGEQTVADVLATGLGARENITTRFTAQMRYRGQGCEVAVAIDRGIFTSDDPAFRLAAAFAAAYRALYGRTASGPIEIMAWSARSALAVAATRPPPDAIEPRQADAPSFRSRPLTDFATGIAAPATAWRREELAPGARIVGPAVIFDTGTTIIVPRSWAAAVAAGGHLMLRRCAGRSGDAAA